MDLDRYLATHRPSWDRLAQLISMGGRRAKRLDHDQVTELVALYQQASSNLSYIRSYYRDPALVAYLTALVSSAGSVIYGTKARTWQMLATFFVRTFPAATWRARRFVAVSAGFLLIPALVLAVWVAHSPAALNSFGSESARDAYVHQDFENYYESEKAAQFGSKVFTNNVEVSILAFSSGILLGVPTAFLLITNGANLGVAAGVFATFHEQGRFWGLILPHGLMELTAIIIAGAAGLQLGWAVVAPGDRRRGTAIVHEARCLVVIVLGLVPAFGVAGTIEGFVTGQPWPAWLRVGIGAVAWVSFLIYVYVQGKQAEAQGFTGALGEEDHRGWAALPA